MQRSREIGIRLLCGSDSGNNSFMPFGELHAKEAEILVRYGGFSPLEAISPATKRQCLRRWPRRRGRRAEAGQARRRDRAEARPVADITVLAGGRHLAQVIKDGRSVDLGKDDAPLRFRHAAA